MAEYNVDKFTYNSNTYKFVDNTSGYVKTSSNAASGGTTLSLVTTGEKYTWNNKSNLTLGTTSSTAYRGDYGNTAYSHATDSSRLTTATSSGLYKIASTAQGHIASLTAISKTDITGLGIPAQDTTYSSLAAASGGTDVSLVTTGLKYTWNNKSSLAIGTTASTAAAGNHAHGNITNAGDITTTATIASGDRIVINDESASKITNSSITFGSSTTTFLRNDGTWAVPAGGSGGGSITQTNTTTGTAYRILFSDGQNDTDEPSTIVRKNTGLLFNPETGTLTTTQLTLKANNTDHTFVAADIDKIHNIGTSQINNTTTSLNSGTTKTLATVTLPSTGKWLCFILVRFDVHATGRRYICISESNSGDSMSHPIGSQSNTDARGYCDSVPAVSGATTTAQIQCCIDTSLFSNRTTYYINGYQNSGTTKNAYCFYQFIKIV